MLSDQKNEWKRRDIVPLKEPTTKILFFWLVVVLLEDFYAIINIDAQWLIIIVIITFMDFKNLETFLAFFNLSISLGNIHS